jgi:RNA polymerase sigma-70 factor (ECF subfamily)
VKDSIPHDTYEQFIRLFVAQEGRLRAFLRTLVPSLDELDEVMQETSLVAWRKFSQFEPGTDFLAWVATIGRFEALRWRRDRAADRLVFSEQLGELLADEARALDLCLEKLPARQRQWLAAAYQPGVKFREVAQTSGQERRMPRGTSRGPSRHSVAAGRLGRRLLADHRPRAGNSAERRAAHAVFPTFRLRRRGQPMELTGKRVSGH